MRRLALLTVLLSLGACNRGNRSAADAAPSHAQATPTAESGSALMNSRCVICHSVEYLSQQRLSEPQWRKTVDKMRLFGAPLSDDEAAVLTSALVRSFPADLPPAEFPRVAPPTGALPER